MPEVIQLFEPIHASLLDQNSGQERYNVYNREAARFSREDLLNCLHVALQENPVFNFAVLLYPDEMAGWSNPKWIHYEAFPLDNPDQDLHLKYVADALFSGLHNFGKWNLMPRNELYFVAGAKSSEEAAAAVKTFDKNEEVA